MAPSIPGNSDAQPGYHTAGLANLLHNLSHNHGPMGLGSSSQRVSTQAPYMLIESVPSHPAGHAWQGRACHYDGYPDHQGRVLFDAVTGHFVGDVDAACRYLIDEHPAGWSVLGGDFTQPPGFHAAGNAGDRNQCYCHGDRDEPLEGLLDPDTARACSTQYAYVLGPDGMRVLRASRGGWDQLAELAWDDQPDWHAIQPSP